MTVEQQLLLAYLVSLALIMVMKIVCFVLGYLTVRLGYKLIVSGVTGEFKLAATLGGLKADLASVSPGLLFVLLGVLLIGYAIGLSKDVTVALPTQAAKAAPAPPVPGPLTLEKERPK